MITLLSQACDPGFSYRPDDWEAKDGGFEWTKTFGEVEFSTWGINGLVGSQSITPELETKNKGSSAIVLESAELLVDGYLLPARLPGQGEAQWRTVPSGAIRRISLQWDFKGSALKALGSKPRMILKFRKGDQPLTIEIPYTTAK